MRENLTGTEPFGSLPRNPALDLFLGREVESLETQVLSDPAFMLLLSRLAPGKFHSQDGREIELAAEKVEDAGRHAGIVIDKPPVASHHTELDGEPQATVVASTTPNLFPVRCREGPISR
jgi:hypothetical protein